MPALANITVTGKMQEKQVNVWKLRREDGKQRGFLDFEASVCDILMDPGFCLKLPAACWLFSNWYHAPPPRLLCTGSLLGTPQPQP